MKKIFLGILGLTLIACSADKKQDDSPIEHTEVVTNFTKDITSLEELESKTPIQDFIKGTANTASKQIELTKANVKEVLAEANNYEKTVVIVEEHTIVKLINLEDCSPSGSWGACMPKGKGYIKKGALVAQKDYINNIIGIPDNQKRTVYFFD